MSEETLPLLFSESSDDTSPDSQYGKTSPEFLIHETMLSDIYWEALLGRIKYQALTVVKDKDGETQVLYLGLKEWPHGGCSMPNISEFPNDVDECSLSQVLEKWGSHLVKYYLSPKACAGILRRAEKRGKKLPEVLEASLIARIGKIQTTL